MNTFLPGQLVYSKPDIFGSIGLRDVPSFNSFDCGDVINIIGHLRVGRIGTVIARHVNRDKELWLLVLADGSLGWTSRWRELRLVLRRKRTR